LNAALDRGYRVLALNEVSQKCKFFHQILQVWNWSDWRADERSLFRGFVSRFLGMKAENSGFPRNITEIKDPNERVAAKLAYILEFERREGIRLSYPDIKLNEAKRFISKVSVLNLKNNHFSDLPQLNVG
jgi:hypothetical protein